MDNKKTITVGSMFAGIGGIELAFEQVGCKTIWANEKDKYACKTYRLNFDEDSGVRKHNTETIATGIIKG